MKLHIISGTKRNAGNGNHSIITSTLEQLNLQFTSVMSIQRYHYISLVVLNKRSEEYSIASHAHVEDLRQCRYITTRSKSTFTNKIFMQRGKQKE